MNNTFDIPVVLFFYKRIDKLKLIIDVLRKVKPSKIYLLSDGPKSEEDKSSISQNRKKIENMIDWECDVVKVYHDNNVGVYENIGEGSKWVLSKEKMAIFLEDDNLPHETFFKFCKEMLLKYYDNDKIFWICGTNYLEDKYKSKENSSYLFTQHLMPCGWASWSHKFSKYYDGTIEYIFKRRNIIQTRRNYENKALFRYQLKNLKHEYEQKLEGKKFKSWDHQLAFSIRYHDVYGIVPTVNLIENIGVDIFSEHGGTSFTNIMTKRFCSIKSQQLTFPLQHPKLVIKDMDYERLVAKIILPPFGLRFKKDFKQAIKNVIGFLIGRKKLDKLLDIKRKKLRKNK